MSATAQVQKLRPRILEVKMAGSWTGTAFKIGLMNEKGEIALSNQTFATEHEANQALNRWRRDNDDKFRTEQ